MTEEEIVIRAREACIAAGYTRGLGITDEIATGDERAIREGRRDNNWSVLCAAHALRDLSKPLSEIQSVDPILFEEARKLVEKRGWNVYSDPAAPGWPYSAQKLAYEAMLRGRELERQS